MTTEEKKELFLNEIKAFVSEFSDAINSNAEKTMKDNTIDMEDAFSELDEAAVRKFAFEVVVGAVEVINNKLKEVICP